MTSQSEWKNPSDVMKKHFMQRNSSFNLSKSKSASKAGIGRRHSFTVLSQSSDNSQNQQTLSSPCEASSTRSQGSRSQKRSNPFGCDASIPNKRMSVLNQEAGTETKRHMSPSQIDTSACYKSSSNFQSSADLGLHSTLETTQNRLLHALTLQEQKECSKGLLQQKSQTDKNEIDKCQLISQQHEVLKEKPVILNTIVTTNEINQEHLKVSSNPPVDWSLKSKLRVTIHTSVAAFKKYPGIDAKNVDSFVHHKLDNSPEWRHLDTLQQIKRCCFHYSYPNMPWLMTFPRISSDFNSRLPSLIANSKDVIESLHKDWCNIFTSIYQQLQAGLCPYFYICSHQFSVLFRCLRSHEHTSWSALLSPSTRGFREMLTKEGITFKMPNTRSERSGSLHKHKDDKICLRNEKTTLSTSQLDKDNQDDDCTHDNNSSQKENVSRNITDKLYTDDNDDSSDEDNNISNDDEASRWLEGMGLDKKDFPSLEPYKVKLQREGFREIDNRPQSLVYVEGVDVHSFFNFLLNYQSIIASSGPQHGVPPTILSPVSFVGGRLVHNMVKHSTLNNELSSVDSQVSNSKNKYTQVFEICGPMLPHHILNISSILHNSPDCEASSMSFSTHMPSAAFNTRIEHDAEKDKLAEGLSKLFVDLSQANGGLLHDVKNQLVAAPVLDSCSSVRELQIRKSGFYWTC